MGIVLIVRFALGLILLVAGAELLVRGASRLAATWGVSPLVIGLTVVAFGTSAPEMAVSVVATLDGRAGIAVGNVVGSNIFNVLFILGISAVVAPLAVSAQLVRMDVPVMVLISFVLWGAALNGFLSVLESLLMFIAILVYTTLLIVSSRRETSGAGGPGEPIPVRSPKPLIDLGLVVLGLVMLVFGSGWLVDGATVMARAVGVSELIIGLTVVAAGTSLPELATSVLATVRGQRDIAVGNVVGSNIFNIFGILGVSGLVGGGIEIPPAAMTFDIPVMTAVAVACLPIFFSGHCITRWEGLLFLGYYAAYTTYLILSATAHDALPVFSQVMLGFVVPLTAVTLVLASVRGWRTRT
jgi:cation:H+ antiporter